ncbi:ComEC/Rec2 family competence protein [Microcella sp.]|uniref:ComEC/Rec2 family competence protein n=1 Tax=Microcella sp. TaxID=1913979 RepID=UPI003F722848
MTPPRAIDGRLALPALAGWLAALALVGAPEAAAPVGLGALALAGLAVGVLRHRSRAARTIAVVAAGIPSVVAIAVIAAAVALAAPARTPPVLASALDGGGSVAAVLELEQSGVAPPPGPGSGWGGVSADALIVSVVLDDAPSIAVRVPVRVLGLEVGERLALGTRLEGRVRLIALEAGDDRVALVRPVTALEPVAAAPPLVAGADALRAGFLALMSAFAGDGAALLPGLAIGDTTAVSDDLDAAMKASALSHLTAVSGANCAIVVGLVLGIGALARWPRPVRVGAALLALGGFVVLVTPEPSVVRAAVMAAVVLLALVSGRPARGLPVLGIAVLGIIVLDPWIAREYGFALSVLATAALLVLAGPLAALLARVLPAWLALAIAVPLSAQLACQPVLILLAPEVPLSGVIANVLAAPAAPVATIVGMIACLLAPVIPPLAMLVAGLAWLPAAWIAGVARVTSQLPGALLPWPEGLAGALLLAGLTVAGLLAAGVPARLGTARLRRRLALVTAAVLVVVMGATAGTAALRTLGRPGDWVIAQCDIGQGDAVLVRSAGAVALIDTGAEPERLSACLDTLGVGRIDLLVLTHFDLDHAGGTPAVIGRVDRALIGPTDGPLDEHLVDALVAGGAEVETVAAGARGQLGDHRWRVLWPPAHRGVEPGNDASIVLELRGATCGDCPSMLALGDLGADAQRMLAAAQPLAPVDVVKVSHHGSPDQHEPLYTDLGAPVALIGVGADNTYGHPAPALLEVLAGAGSTVLRSDVHGLVLLAPAGGSEAGLRLWSERGGVGPPR